MPESTRLKRALATVVAAAPPPEPSLDLGPIEARLDTFQLWQAESDMRGLVAEVRRLTAELAAKQATVRRVEALRDEYRSDDNASLSTFGQHHPVAGIAADHLDAALDGVA